MGREPLLPAQEPSKALAGPTSVISFPPFKPDEYQREGGFVRGCGGGDPPAAPQPRGAGKMRLHQDSARVRRTGCKPRSFPSICPPARGQGCARGWQGRSGARVSARALELATGHCLPTARLAPGPASLVGKAEIRISEHFIWRFCKAERSLRSRLTVARVLYRKSIPSARTGSRALLTLFGTVSFCI